LAWKASTPWNTLTSPFEGDGDPTLHTGPVPDSDAAYLRLAAKHLKPLSDEDYMSGPAGILHTLAKYS
jgi:hypothetical protein